jgi:medium-chain acyl-[acyl-carrier-protein] hydrolase
MNVPPQTKFNPWVSCPRPNPGARVRLFCFPYSGAAANIYYPWADVLPPSWEICPVQLPGRGTRMREPLQTRLAEQVEALAAGIRPYLDKPFAFFGHSMGALTSFELARHLRRTHAPLPIAMFVSGHGAPHLPDRNPPLHALPEAEFLAKLRELNGTPEEVLQHQELLQLLVPILRADFAVCETYVYQAEDPLACSIHAYAGLGDDYVNRQELEGWREQTSGAFSVRMFPGDHFFLNSARPYLLQALARELEQRMAGMPLQSGPR